MSSSGSLKIWPGEHVPSVISRSVSVSSFGRNRSQKSATQYSNRLWVISGFDFAPETVNGFPSASLSLPLSHFLNQPEFDKGPVKGVFDPGARRSTWMVGANENVEVLGKSDGAV